MKEIEGDRYLIFRIGKEAFAAPLLSIREIVEPLVYRPVPNMNDYFLGMANLRGQIIGVLDLGIRFGLGPVVGSKESVFLIFEVDGTVMAGLANRVESVMVISADSIVQDHQVDMTIPPAASIGIAKSDAGLLPIVQLPEILRSA